jgi:hypothetical protein
MVLNDQLFSSVSKQLKQLFLASVPPLIENYSSDPKFNFLVEADNIMLSLFSMSTSKYPAHMLPRYSYPLAGLFMYQFCNTSEAGSLLPSSTSS